MRQIIGSFSLEVEIQFYFCCSAQSDVGHSSGHSASSGDLISGNYKKDTAEALSTWNPFEDTTPFSQAVPEEEDLFGAEFDKIRQEGESKFPSR